MQIYIISLVLAHTSYLSRTPRIYSCKFFLAGVNFYRFSAKNWQFTVFFFFIDPTPKLSCLALGNPSDQQHCTIAHISIAPPLFEVYNGFESWFASLSSLFDIWPCSLARSCRRCWCRSAAREGEPRGRQSSCRTALQRCWPALCCAPRNKRLAGYLMWC